ncbi:DHA2 family efflux MFS transporter permease subunit [Streptomyces sp. NPDC060194]|uniref:MDR family MFS transporter n=1 Tax=Streptomyces sp. NPDC060194 TaxID=3347069 RepID=UPI00365C784A
MGASETTADTSERDGPSGEERRRILVSMGALLLGMLLAALDQTIVATALPTIVSELGGADHLSWVVTAYMLAATASTPLWGKLGDMYGRKKVFQTVIVIFLIGSALSGVAQNMTELIAFRALQGLGGGGLMVLSLAIVGDLVPPRERGRYQGLFGSVFGVSSVLGPLLGGFFTEHLSWRWVFYINLPIGIVALVVIAAVLHIPVRSTPHRIDYAGITLLAASAAGVVLVTSLGGVTWAWGSWQIIALCVLTVVCVALFVPVERRAAEPVMPLKLFADPVFRVCALIGFIIGFAMFGAMTYLPLFLQVVQGITPTMSGLHMLPMVLGMLIASIGCGRLVTQTGHYKIFPVLGTAITALGLLLLHQLHPDTATALASVYFLVFGFGLGLVMPIITLAVQNAVGYEDLGVATSGVTFFRSIGACVGVAVFGSIFNARLETHLAENLAEQTLPPGFDPAAVEADPQRIADLPAALRESILDAYSVSITDVFIWSVPVALLGFVVALFLKEIPVRTAVTVPDMSETVGTNPTARSSRDEVLRALSWLGTREGRRQVYVDINRDAGLDLLPAASWLLLRIRRHGTVTPGELAERAPVPLDVILDAGRQVEERGYARREGVQLVLTDEGAQLATTLAAARERTLCALLGDWWGPDRPTDLVQLVSELNEELAGSRQEQPRY